MPKRISRLVGLLIILCLLANSFDRNFIPIQSNFPTFTKNQAPLGIDLQSEALIPPAVGATYHYLIPALGFMIIAMALGNLMPLPTARAQLLGGSPSAAQEIGADQRDVQIRDLEPILRRKSTPETKAQLIQWTTRYMVQRKKVDVSKLSIVIIRLPINPLSGGVLFFTSDVMSMLDSGAAKAIAKKYGGGYIIKPRLNPSQIAVLRSHQESDPVLGINEDAVFGGPSSDPEKFLGSLFHEEGHLLQPKEEDLTDRILAELQSKVRTDSALAKRNVSWDEVRKHVFKAMLARGEVQAIDYGFRETTKIFGPNSENAFEQRYRKNKATEYLSERRKLGKWFPESLLYPYFNTDDIRQPRDDRTSPDRAKFDAGAGIPFPGRFSQNQKLRQAA